MSEWIFTFGFGHVHPLTGESLAKRFIRIEASDDMAARVEMIRRFGKRWSMQYASPEQAGVETYDLKELLP